jgi:hypothetical protein
MLVELELYWSEVFSTVVLVAPLPSFDALDERLLRWPRDAVGRLPARTVEIEAFAAARKRVDGSALRIIEAAPLFCGDRPGCSALGNGPLMLDAASHLTVEGAKGYAARLEASGQLQALAP